MAYIGNTVQNQGFTPAIDYFNGNGVTVTFTLSRPIASVAQVIVAVDNVIQNPSSAFNVVGNSITFTSAPLSGTNNIWVEYTSLITTYQGISQDPTVIGDIRATGGYLAEGDFGNSYIDGTIVDYVTGNARITTGPLDNMTFYHGGTASRSEMMELYYAGGAKIYGTTALTIPSGTTAQRPASPSVGATRFNTTNGQLECYNGTSWVLSSTAPTYTAEYLIVSGGGGGGQEYSGGGGAGGVLSGSFTASVSFAYPVTVGAGGAAGTSGGQGSDGATSTFNSNTPVGGGGGGGDSPGPDAGRNGGSGGGGAIDGGGGSGTAGQGSAGGGGNRGSNLSGGGGGGAGGVGAGGGPGGGAGGVGTSTYSAWGSATSTGQNVGGTYYYAGGGGGGTASFYGGSQGLGGSGGGGNGSNSGNRETAGTANTGGGGGASSNYATPIGNGGSGVVIIRYAGSQRATGGTVTSAGGYTYHTFTSSGTYTA